MTTPSTGRLTTSSFPADRSEPLVEITTGQLLREAAAAEPDHTALLEVTPAGAPSLVGADRTDRQWTYAELLAEAEHCAQWLLQRFRPGERITVWAPNVPEWIILQYGAALAGLVLVTANPGLRANELRYVIEQSRSAGLVHAASFRGSDMAAAAVEACDGLPNLRARIDMSTWESTVRGVEITTPADLPVVRPRDPAQIQYTSGTTGFPKGALLHHHGLVNNAAFMIRRTQLPPGGTVASAMPLFHTAGCAMSVLGIAHQRGTYAMCQLFDPGLLLGAAATHRADVIFGVPTMLGALLAHPEFDTYDLTACRIALSGGSQVPPELVREVEQRFGCRFTIVYGQTELSPVVTQTSPDDSIEDKADTVGLPLPHVDVRVVEPNTDHVVDIGEQGEIQARGYQAMLGYFDMPDRTAETMDENGWLRTGDLGTMDDRGYLRVTGRLKEMLIRGGENIFPVEIERVLYAHRQIAEVAVFGLPDPHWGEIVAAVVQPTTPTDLPSTGELHRLCREQLAPHKTPVRWMYTDEMPLTGSGKIRKFVLAERAGQGRLPDLPP